MIRDIANKLLAVHAGRLVEDK
jgi:hypothetical protein